MTSATPDLPPALDLRDVSRRFGDTVAIDRLSLTVVPGEVLALLGHNGAGKTTTVRLLAGLLAPDAGTVRVEGRDPVEDGVTVRRRLGVLPAAAPVDSRLTGRANLRLAADLFGVPRADVDARVEESLGRFGLADRGDERVEGYSSGMRQRLGLARVLLPDPQMLLLDEPTAALDPIAARDVRRLVAELAAERGRTVVLCTHDLVEAQALATRVAVLEHGRLVALGTPAELARSVSSGGVAVTVDPADLARAVAAAGEGAERDGDEVLRCPGLTREGVPGLVRRLVAADVRVYAVESLEASLTDVYVALHERAAGTGRVQP